jgi:lysophospholipase L1-like esterase
MWRRKIAGLAAAVSFFWGFAFAAEPPALRGIGVLGDSYSDEYRYYSPDRAQARNWVEFLADARGMNFGSLSDSSRAAPRNQGYAFNWARSAATTETLIDEGQHTGVAAQVAAGEIDVVVLFIGGNDFINAARLADPIGALEKTVSKARENFRLAVATVLSARPDARMVVLTVPDICDLPEVRESLRIASRPQDLRNACVAALKSYNDAIRDTAAREPRIALVDFERINSITRMLAPKRVTVGNRAIDRERPGNSPECLILADRRHLGTVGQGLIAKMIVQKLNLQFSTGLKPVADDEILSYATRVWNESSSASRVASNGSTASGGR